MGNTSFNARLALFCFASLIPALPAAAQTTTDCAPRDYNCYRARPVNGASWNQTQTGPRAALAGNQQAQAASNAAPAPAYTMYQGVPAQAPMAADAAASAPAPAYSMFQTTPAPQTTAPVYQPVAASNAPDYHPHQIMNAPDANADRLSALPHYDETAPAAGYEPIAADGSVAAAGPYTTYTGYNKTTRDFALEGSISGGYQVNRLRWNIAADPTGQAEPNILSELKWKDIDGAATEGELRFRQKTGAMRGLYLDGTARYSGTFSGDNQDSDYIFNNRDGEFSRSNNSSDEGHSERYTAALDWAFEQERSDGLAGMAIIPQVGYAYSKQRYVIQDGNQTIATPGITPDLGPFPGLDSHYDAEWKGPYVGLDYDAKIFDRHHFRLKGSYIWADYHGEANWNLRDDFQHPLSFEHEADGNGWTAAAYYGFRILPSLEFNLHAQLDSFKATGGTDTTYFADGTTAGTRLNEATSFTQYYAVGLTYGF